MRKRDANDNNIQISKLLHIKPFRKNLASNASIVGVTLKENGTKPLVLSCIKQSE
jgi:hypothetical protein